MTPTTPEPTSAGTSGSNASTTSGTTTARQTKPRATSGRRPVDHAAIQRRRLAAGLVDAEGTSRKVRARTCARCSAPVLGALDGAWLAVTVSLDPTPVDVMGELLAVIAGRGTWRLSWCGGHYEVDPRTAIEIERTPPTEVEVLAGHRCGEPLPPAMRAPKSSRRQKAATPTNDSGPPPY